MYVSGSTSSALRRSNCWITSWAYWSKALSGPSHTFAKRVQQSCSGLQMKVILKSNILQHTRTYGMECSLIPHQHSPVKNTWFIRRGWWFCGASGRTARSPLHCSFLASVVAIAWMWTTCGWCWHRSAGSRRASRWMPRPSDVSFFLRKPFLFILSFFGPLLAFPYSHMFPQVAECIGQCSFFHNSSSSFLGEIFRRLQKAFAAILTQADLGLSLSVFFLSIMQIIVVVSGRQLGGVRTSKKFARVCRFLNSFEVKPLMPKSLSGSTWFYFANT